MRPARGILEEAFLFLGGKYIFFCEIILLLSKFHILRSLLLCVNMVGTQQISENKTVPCTHSCERT